MPRPVVSYSQEVRETHPTQTEVKTMTNFEELYSISCEEFYNGDFETMMDELAEEIIAEGLVEG